MVQLESGMCTNTLNGFDLRDMQSYVSRLFLLMANESLKLVLFVDNEPWTTKENLSKPAELWQLMLTQSRVSPFANRKRKKFSGQLSREDLHSKATLTGDNSQRKGSIPEQHESSDSGWLSLKRYFQCQCKALAHVKKPYHGLHGCVTFEILWADVRGINYSNELQADTCIALEAKTMIKREFDSLEEAQTFYALERCRRISQYGIQPAEASGEESFGEGFQSDKSAMGCSCVSDTSATSWSVDGSSTTDENPDAGDRTGLRMPFAEEVDHGERTCNESGRRALEFVTPPSSPDRTFFCQCLDTWTGYSHIQSEPFRDSLVVLRFAEPLLPFELKKIITADPRLLKMLESGLPSWVIFLQSYPIFCHMYRPWMRPLCGTIYYMVSVVTVLIGFYDLYKNVPVLKATAAHLCGPLFEWIEGWEMVSRLKYLGTMLVLQNFEKAFQWALMTVRAFRQLTSLLMRPIVEPLTLLGDILLPLWTSLLEGILAFGDLISPLIFTTFSTVTGIFSFLLWPFYILVSTLWNLGVYPLLVATWALLGLPVQAIRMLLSVAAGVVDGIIDMLQLILASAMPSFSTFQGAKAVTPGPSMWRALWNDIFSKVFRAVRSIVNGFMAFFTACNRHRLSIYNHVVACLFRLTTILNSGQTAAVTACKQLFLVPGSKPGVNEKVEENGEELRCRNRSREKKCVSTSF
ncbi:unnamed protein product [Sphagnum jensenii]|uniref:Uncharacterized protein n=1 Tax=Sphagnum jensenii TaxID=128206 RepID=A0ABP0W7Y7_9BRYO